MRLLSLSLASLLFSPPMGVAQGEAATSAEALAPAAQAAPASPSPEAQEEPPAPDKPLDEAEVDAEVDAEDATGRLTPQSIARDAGPGAGEVLDTVLACGMRVRIAQDSSLPVAAVVLAIESGTVHDPDDQPGLVHALAYQLLMGSHELRPGQALADVQDYGGLSTLAVGAGQVRFESLTPWAQLDAALAVEARRLRAPSKSHALWLKALSYARRDRKPRSALPEPARAKLWQQAGLAHEGRLVHAALSQMPQGAIGAQLSRLFSYNRATLVVVAPASPQETLAQVRRHFDPLPKRKRELRKRSAFPKPAASSEVREYPAPRQAGDVYVWPVPHDAGSQAWAQSLCAAISRAPTLPGEAARTRVTCQYLPDARFPAIAVRGGGPDKLASIERRFDAFAQGQLDAQWEQAASAKRGELAQDESRPMDLAILLARADESASDDEAARDRADYSGRAALDPKRYAQQPARFDEILSRAFALRLAPQGAKAGGPNRPNTAEKPAVSPPKPEADAKPKGAR